MSPSFVHLRAHSEKSLVDSTLRIEDLVAQTKAHGAPAVALTDASNFFGAVSFQSQARKAGVKPIFGVDVSVEGADASDKPSRLLLLAESEAGRRNLMTLVSRGYTDNNQGGQAVVRREWLAELNEGVLCLSGDEKDGEIGKALVAGDFEKAKLAAQHWAQVFPGRFYIELQRRGGKHEAAFVEGAARLASELGLPPVATHPVQFLKKEDFLAHEVRVCIKNDDVLYDAERPRLFTNEQYLKSPQEMEELFSDIPQAISNANAIARRCNAAIPTGQGYHLPDFETPDGSSLEDYFPRAAHEGLERRLIELYPDAAVRDAKRPEYQKRLDFELGTIGKMGFQGYFMIVSDFIRWGLEHDVPIGPGRGSGAGSLVAYSLNITDLDPLRFNLLFERFLNPDRVSMPDFDVDFCSEKRALVIDYVREKYGHDAVSQIITFGTYGAKSAMKSIGKALNMNYLALDEISKLMTAKPGEAKSIDEFIAADPRIQELLDNDAALRRVFDYARQLDGLTSNLGKHAGGVVIAPGRVSDHSAVYVPRDSNEPVSQFDKDDIEKVGLVKFDLLAISTLTHLDKAVKLIRRTTDHKGFNLKSIDMARVDVYESIFSQGNTFGIFQMEEKGITQLAVDAGVESIEHLTDVLALYRPGTLQAGVDRNYVERKRGREKVESLHPMLDEILSPTHGVIVYQEQVMQVAQKLSGYSLGGADLLRRAMGKKKPEEMAAQKSTFLDGAQKNGVPPEQAAKIFEYVEKFAEYGFNKSHSAAYAYLAYQTAYIKHVFPVHFYCAAFSTFLDDTERLAKIVNDAKKNGLTLLPPDLHASEADFTIVSSEEKSLRFGFAGLRGVGALAADALCKLRAASGPFESLEDLCVKIKAGGKAYSSINKKALESLIFAGALDQIEPNREHAAKSLSAWLSYASKVQDREEKMGAAPVSGAIGPLLAVLAASHPAPAAPADGRAFPSYVGPLSAAQQKTVKRLANLKPVARPEIEPAQPEDPMARLKNEKTALGFYISGHPFEEHKRALGGLGWTKPLSEVAEMAPTAGYATVAVAGTVVEIKTFNSPKGKFARVQIDDGTGEASVVMFADAYAEAASWLKTDQFICMEITTRADKRNPTMAAPAAQTALNLEQTKARLADKLNVRLLPEQGAQAIALSQEHPGLVQVTLWHPLDGGAYAQAPLKLGVSGEAGALDAFKKAFGDDNVRVSYKASYQFPRAPRKNNAPAARRFNSGQ